MSNKPKHCCVCTSSRDLVPYMGTRFRCKICEQEGRQPSAVRKGETCAIGILQITIATNY